MLSPERQADLLAEARRVDTVLGGAGIKRSVISPVVQRYISGPGSHDERLKRAHGLAKQLTKSDCWLRRRSAGMPQQLPIVSRELGVVLESGYDEEELRFVLGWIMRLARMRDD